MNDIGFVHKKYEKKETKMRVMNLESAFAKKIKVDAKQTNDRT
jgi:hypothetical protein